MTFNPTLFNNILYKIEKNLSFENEDIYTPNGWNLKLNLKVQDMFDEYQGEETGIKYILEVLYLMNCIEFAPNDHSTIGGVTPKGLQFIFSHLHNIDFD